MFRIQKEGTESHRNMVVCYGTQKVIIELKRQRKLEHDLRKNIFSLETIVIINDTTVVIVVTPTTTTIIIIIITIIIIIVDCLITDTSISTAKNALVCTRCILRYTLHVLYVS